MAIGASAVEELRVPGFDLHQDSLPGPSVTIVDSHFQFHQRHGTISIRDLTGIVAVGNVGGWAGRSRRRRCWSRCGSCRRRDRGRRCDRRRWRRCHTFEQHIVLADLSLADVQSLVHVSSQLVLIVGFAPLLCLLVFIPPLNASVEEHSRQATRIIRSPIVQCLQVLDSFFPVTLFGGFAAFAVVLCSIPVVASLLFVLRP